jgi:hypothetical protein
MREHTEGERGFRRCADYGQDEQRALIPMMAAQFGGSIAGYAPGRRQAGDNSAVLKLILRLLPIGPHPEKASSPSGLITQCAGTILSASFSGR